MAALTVNIPVRNNLSILKSNTNNVNLFIERLFTNNILDITKKNQLSAITDTEEKLAEIYDYLLYNTGPVDTPSICLSLGESGNSMLIAILEADSYTEDYTTESNRQLHLRYPSNTHKAFYFQPLDPTIPLSESQGCDETDSSPLRRDHVRPATKRLDLNPPAPWKAYKMGSRPKGYALLINMESFPNDPRKNRDGSMTDLQNLKELFTELGYVVEDYNNLKSVELIKVVEEFSKDKKHLSVDSCVVFIMSHGDKDSKRDQYINIECSDLNTVNTCEIINKFVYPHTQVFGTDKPILFFFQACRGHHKDYGQPNRPQTEQTLFTSNTVTDGILRGSPVVSEISVKGRKYDHMLIINACVPGHVALRDPDEGAWFVKNIVKVFSRYACEYDIDTMLSMVDEEIRPLACELNGMQTTTVEKWGFTRKFYFNPGLYDDDPILSSPVINAACENPGDCAVSQVEEKSKELQIEETENLSNIFRETLISYPPPRPASSNGDLAQSTVL